jgi:hypothetical protein
MLSKKWCSFFPPKICYNVLLCKELFTSVNHKGIELFSVSSVAKNYSVAKDYYGQTQKQACPP